MANVKGSNYREFTDYRYKGGAVMKDKTLEEYLTERLSVRREWEDSEYKYYESNQHKYFIDLFKILNITKGEYKLFVPYESAGALSEQLFIKDMVKYTHENNLQNEYNSYILPRMLFGLELVVMSKDEYISY
jgi:hypothetical protein